MIGMAAFAIIAEAASNGPATVPDTAYTYPETVDASVSAPTALVVTTLSAVAPTYVSTFECIGLYWSPTAPADQVCTVQYRIAGLGGVWNNAMNLWYDARALNGRPAEYRGSIVGLIPGASYEVRVTLADGTTSTITAATMSETFPVGTTVLLPATSATSLAITTGGTADAYKLYTFDPANGSATIDVQKTANNCITVSAPYVIIRGLTLKGAKVHGIDLANGAHHVVIENNDISDWGSPLTVLANATDGIKTTTIASLTSILAGGPQWLQVDLGASYNLNKVNVWHYWGDGRTFHDVIVQVSNDATFATGVTTVFNNDTDNTSGLGVGTDAEYAETSTGKTITFAAVNARYVRFWSNGYIVPNGATGGYAFYVEVEAYADTTNLAAGILPTISYGAGLGVNLHSAVHGAYHNPTITDIVIQRNKMHDPTYTSNSWDYGHPAGPHGIAFEQDGGGHNIFRYNEITTSNGHFYMDAIGGGENFSLDGVPGPDSDVYGNIATHCYDDGLEMEGGGMNVRVWGNYVDQVATGIASATVAMGPLYIFRNVENTSRHLFNVSPDLDDRLAFGKAGDGGGFGGGKRYYYHNTLLQAPGVTYPLGAGEGVNQSGGPLTNTETRNNILHIWKSWWGSIRDNNLSPTNNFDYDLYNGVITAYAGAEANGIHSTPIYAPNNGWVSGSGGMYALDPSSPGYHVAVPLPNFNDSTATPDMGAHQSGTPPMEFGVNVVRNMVNDGDMSMADTSFWPNMFSPTLKEKIEFGGNRRIHIIGNYPSGAQQSITGYIPGVTYKYSISVYLVSGRCKAQIYQGQFPYIKDLYNFNTPTGSWQTFTGTYTAGVGAGYLIIRFYGYDTAGPSEFYVDNISFTPN